MCPLTHTHTHTHTHTLHGCMQLIKNRYFSKMTGGCATHPPIPSFLVLLHQLGPGPLSKVLCLWALQFLTMRTAGYPRPHLQQFDAEAHPYFYIYSCNCDQMGSTSSANAQSGYSTASADAQSGYSTSSADALSGYSTSSADALSGYSTSSADALSGYSTTSVDALWVFHIIC